MSAQAIYAYYYYEMLDRTSMLLANMADARHVLSLAQKMNGLGYERV